MKPFSSASQHIFPAIPGYTIVEQLYLGSRTAVYRAVQTEEQRPVVIKVLRREYPSFSELVQFRNQYAIAKNLPIAGIVRPLSLEPVGNGYALVMADDGGVALGKYLQRQSLSLEEVLEIALQIADILHELSQNRVVHKDIKPANILIHPESKQIKLIDFSIASLLPKETQEIQSPNILEGTLAYIAPEQTGRMNRCIDYRTDFYSLGVTLYQLLSDTLPFISDDPLELMHCHIAKNPVPIGEVNPAVPGMVSAIVTKLMAKNAEDRYQSALGLKHDLARCLTEWKTTGKILAFELGQRDLSDRFLIPEKLYGREKEVEILLAAFERVAEGATELMLVAGFSGIGKTAVINEVHKPIVRQRGYFIKGKFDQFNRNIPLSAFVQAFRDLMGQLLSEADEQLEQWRTKILSALGENGQVLIEVIPELENIIGKQPAAPELSGTSSQNRFNLLFQKFIQVFTTPAHPLVIFLDDLQWADSASLQLLKLLMEDSGYLLMLGAYRDNEVSPVHPFILMVEELKKAKAIVNTITLAPLTVADTNRLIADTLKCSLELAQPLTELVNRKTKGNPFFTTQFLKALYEEKCIFFNGNRHYWECDIAQINTLALTDDVVEFMALQLQKLPDETQQVLKLAACIGNQFDLATLAIVSEQSPTETATALWRALQEGLIAPISQSYKFFQSQEFQLKAVKQSDEQNSINPGYRFLHDRIQQAAYSLIPPEQKQSTHYRIGNILLENLTEESLEQQIFEIIIHLNTGSSLIFCPSEREALAELNLNAGSKAKSSNAYEVASNYFAKGIDLLTTTCWKDQYQLSLKLFLSRAESEALVGKFELAAQLIEATLSNLDDLLDRCLAYKLSMQIDIAFGQPQTAIKTALTALKLLNITLEEKLPSNVDLDQLLDLPEMSNPQKLKAMEILMSVIGAAYVAEPELMLPVTLTMLKLSNQYGNSAISAFAYVFYGVLLCGFLNNIELGYKYGQLAFQLLEKYNANYLKSEVYHLLYSMVYPWKKAISSTFHGLLESIYSGLNTGNIEYAMYSLKDYCNYYFLNGALLDDVDRRYQEYKELSHKIEFVYYDLAIWRQAGLNLRNSLDANISLSSEKMSEEDVFLYLENKQYTMPLFGAYFVKCQLYYFQNDYEKSLESAKKADTYLKFMIGKVYPAFYNFYVSLALLGISKTKGLEEHSVYLNQVAENQIQLHLWASHAPMNYQHKYDLVEAERCHVLGNRAEAIDLYDRAIAGAKENGYIQEEALANELAAKFYLEWGKEKIATSYMQEAYYGYAHWGARAKVQDLEQRYPELLAPILQQQKATLSVHETVFSPDASSRITSPTSGTQSSSSGSTSISATLDLASILKASQTLSSEIQLDKLLATLLHTVLENAGADKGALLMPRETQWFVEAIATIDRPAIVQSIALSDSLEVPQGFIYAVKHSQQPIVVVDATLHPRFATDVYVMQQRPKSLLCTPILNQGKLIAILYLENRITSGAFTSDRLELLNLLCSQAAISLENARLLAICKIVKPLFCDRDKIYGLFLIIVMMLFLFMH
ncbi:AAA family ATPase [bacterium]|nr:AAA family ATPase [bacterium]